MSEELIPYLSIVIPVFNEEKNIERTIKQIVEFCQTESLAGWEIIVVDDGSSDRTVSLVDTLQNLYPQVTLVKNPHRGKGYSVRTGVLAARGQFILFTDADGSTPIKEVKRHLFWVSEKNFEIAIASREGTGAERYQEPYYRHLMGRVFNLVVQALTLRGIQDSQCGFKLFKKNAAKEIFSRLKIYGEGAAATPFAFTGAFDVEVLFIARKLGYRIKEVPVSWTYSRTDRVNPLRDSWLMFLDVIRIRLNDFRGAYR